MEIGGAVILVRRRLVASSVGLAAFALVGFLGIDDPWAQPWFFVGLGVALSATFLEPYFGTPRAAIVNAVGGIGACAGADPRGVLALWISLAAFFGVVAAAGVVAAIQFPAIVSPFARAFAARFGRASVVGAAILFLLVVTEAESRESGFELLLLASAILVASVSFDWAGLWSKVRRPTEAAAALAAIGPRMLLVAAGTRVFSEGDAVEVDAGNARSTTGHIVARMPHSEGLRYGIALSDEWTTVSQVFPQDITLRERGDAYGFVGAAGSGSTERIVEFEAFGELNVGDPLLIGASERTLLYQVARLRLAEESWAGSQALLSHVTAHLVGWPDGTWIRAVTHLPRPHAPIVRGERVAGSLDAAFHRLGTVKGTDLPLGLRVDFERRGHLAILGMSGMGKTAVAHRICSILGEDHIAVALDTTGEYASRLAFPEWTANDFDTVGHFVHEPAGDPPARAALFIEACMKAGADEYQRGEMPKRRVVLLEEAHTFLPEWNVALRTQQEKVAFSTRMIMQARKFGLTFVVVSQRTAVVSKSALSQCENYIVLKTLDQTGLEYLESLVGPELRDAIPSLERFEAMCVGPAFNSDAPVIITLDPP